MVAIKVYNTIIVLWLGENFYQGVKGLASESIFLLAFFRERMTSPSWYPPIPESHQLSDDDVTEFCQCLRPIVEVSMFSRYGSVETAKLLRDLVVLRPEIFIPVVLEK